MDDTISRQAAIDAIGNVPDHDDGMVWEALSHAQRDVALLPSAQLTEEYAKAVRNWLVQYQVKCAELSGRYTPYEVLGWIVSDWRKENGIW